MEKLLQWSIAQQTGDDEAKKKVGQPDPKMLEQLFGGPDEPTLMKQSIMVVNNEEATLENKEIALENFEMLIENLDNANNIENMKLWPDIIALLSAKEPSLQVLAASIVAIATQNNPKSQDAFAQYSDGFSKLIQLAFDSTTSAELYTKSLSALASLIRNNEAANDKFVELQGLECLSLSDAGSNKKVMMRKLSLISAVISTGINGAKTDSINRHNLVPAIANNLKADNHLSCVEMSLNILAQLVRYNYNFTAQEKQLLTSAITQIQPIKQDLPQDDLDSVTTTFTS